MGVALGIDVGGTFTDFLEIGGVDGARIVKVPSAPAAPAEAVMRGLTQLAGGGDTRLAADMAGVDLDRARNDDHHQRRHHAALC